MTVKFTSTAGVGERGLDSADRRIGAGELRRDGLRQRQDTTRNELGEGNSVQADWGGSLELKINSPSCLPGFPGAPAGDL